MGEYLCKKCKVMHTDIQSNICPLTRKENERKMMETKKKKKKRFDERTIKAIETDGLTALKLYKAVREMLKEFGDMPVYLYTEGVVGEVAQLTATMVEKRVLEHDTGKRMGVVLSDKEFGSQR